MRALAGGGKHLSREQVLQGGLEGGLVGLDRQEVVAPLFVENLLGGFHLGVPRVAQHDLAAHIQAAQQLAGGRNLVALGRGDHPAQKLPRSVGGVDHLHAAVAQLLAIDDDQGVLDGAGQSFLPGQQHRFEHRRIHRREHPGEGGLLGATIASRVLIAPEVQCAQLRLAERVGELGQIIGTQAHAGGHRHDN